MIRDVARRARHMLEILLLESEFHRPRAKGWANVWKIAGEVTRRNPHHDRFRFILLPGENSMRMDRMQSAKAAEYQLSFRPEMPWPKIQQLTVS